MPQCHRLGALPLRKELSDDVKPSQSDAPSVVESSEGALPTAPASPLSSLHGTAPKPSSGELALRLPSSPGRLLSSCSGGMADAHSGSSASSACRGGVRGGLRLPSWEASARKSLLRHPAGVSHSSGSGCATAGAAKDAARARSSASSCRNVSRSCHSSPAMKRPSRSMTFISSSASATPLIMSARRALNVPLGLAGGEGLHVAAGRRQQLSGAQYAAVLSTLRPHPPSTDRWALQP
mmetsp:Transcript_58573/g.156794  ORF Transcript_58573/g.156794 Transcript_58573/m.156794 type:complete len:237 (+) Transcript_58573:157-867(+)